MAVEPLGKPFTVEATAMHDSKLLPKFTVLQRCAA